MQYSQINSIPTPLLCWVSGVFLPQVTDSGGISDFALSLSIGLSVITDSEADNAGNSFFALSAFNYYITEPATVEETGAASGFALKSLSVTLQPKTVSVSETGAASNFGLSSVIVFTPSIGSTGDNGNSSFALKNI